MNDLIFLSITAYLVCAMMVVWASIRGQKAAYLVFCVLTFIMSLFVIILTVWNHDFLIAAIWVIAAALWHRSSVEAARKLLED